MATNSIVDYLNSKKQDSSKLARKKLYEQYYPDETYNYTADQNTKLLNLLKIQNKDNDTTNSVGGTNPEQNTNVVSGNVPKVNNVNETPSTTNGSNISKSLNYYNRLTEAENNTPSAYSSNYENLISDVLDTINNRKAFDITNDANYNTLYNQYAQSYQNQARQAMNDAMANAQIASGGYGNSYAQVAGQQAYDNTMSQLNDNNINLMNLAYDVYQNNLNNDYNKLSALQSLDNTEYNRYRDTVSDALNERNYLANRYDTEYANETDAENTAYNRQYQANRDAISDALDQKQLELQTVKAANGTDTSNAGTKVPEDTRKTISSQLENFAIMGDNEGAYNYMMQIAQAYPDYVEWMSEEAALLGLDFNFKTTVVSDNPR